MIEFIQKIFRSLFPIRELDNPPEWREFLYSLDYYAFGNWLDRALQNLNLYPIVVNRVDTNIEDILINSYEMAVEKSSFRSHFKFWINEILSRWDTEFFPKESFVAIVNIIGYTNMADKGTLSVLNEMALSQDYKNEDLKHEEIPLHNHLLKTIIGYTLDDSFLTILNRDILEPEYSAICAEGLWRRGKGEAAKYIWHLTKIERLNLTLHEIEDVLRDWIKDIGLNSFINDLQNVVSVNNFSRQPEPQDIDRLLRAFSNLGYKTDNIPRPGKLFQVDIVSSDVNEVELVENILFDLDAFQFGPHILSETIKIQALIQLELSEIIRPQIDLWNLIKPQIDEITRSPLENIPN